MNILIFSNLLILRHILNLKGGFNEWDRTFFDDELSRYDNFHDFVRNWLTPENITKHHHFKPQYSYIIDKYNRVSVDYIGYFENIEDDFETIKKKIGVDARLEKKNAVNRKSYTDYYDDETIAIVESVYEKDIKLFNYCFTGPKSFVRTLKL